MQHERAAVLVTWRPTTEFAHATRFDVVAKMPILLLIPRPFLPRIVAQRRRRVEGEYKQSTTNPQLGGRHTHRARTPLVGTWKLRLLGVDILPGSRNRFVKTLLPVRVVVDRKGSLISGFLQLLVEARLHRE